MNQRLSSIDEIKNSVYLSKLRQPKVLLSTLGFQVAWWQLLFNVSQGRTVLGCLLTLSYVAFHVFVTAHPRWKKELIFVFLFALLGWCGDVLLTTLTIQKFPQHFGAPFWLFCLWLNYMTSIYYSVAQVFFHRGLTLFLGFIFGPWTYWACEKMGLVEFPHSALLAGLIQGVMWMTWMWIYRAVLKKYP